MSAVSNSVTPSSRAASTTARVAASSIRPPKLLHPTPTSETVRLPMARVSMRLDVRCRSVPRQDVLRPLDRSLPLGGRFVHRDVGAGAALILADQGWNRPDPRELGSVSP